MDYEKDLEINEHSLDREWIRQPAIFMFYAKKTAEADRKRKRAKENLEVLYAEIDSWVREEAKKEGEKVTEKMVENRVRTDKTYTDAAKEVSEAEFEYNIMLSAVKAMDHKKAALENLVKLYISGYLSTPRQTNSEHKESSTEESEQASSDDVIDRLSAGQKERLNKRRERKLNNDK